MPRKYPEAFDKFRGKLMSASMRPGRMPRKYLDDKTLNAYPERSFNEAGADAPEIPLHAQDNCRAD